MRQNVPVRRRRGMQCCVMAHVNSYIHDRHHHPSITHVFIHMPRHYICFLTSFLKSYPSHLPSARRPVPPSTICYPPQSVLTFCAPQPPDPALSTITHPLRRLIYAPPKERRRNILFIACECFRPHACFRGSHEHLICNRSARAGAAARRDFVVRGGPTPRRIRAAGRRTRINLGQVSPVLHILPFFASLTLSSCVTYENFELLLEPLNRRSWTYSRSVYGPLPDPL